MSEAPKREPTTEERLVRTQAALQIALDTLIDIATKGDGIPFPMRARGAIMKMEKVLDADA